MFSDNDFHGASLLISELDYANTTVQFQNASLNVHMKLLANFLWLGIYSFWKRKFPEKNPVVCLE